MAPKNLLKPILFSIFMLPLLVAAQISSSPYSFYGLGESAYQGDVYSSAMGYASIALQDSLHINPINPASYRRDSLDFTFNFAFIAKGYSLKSTTSSQQNFGGNLNYMSVAFRFFKWWNTSLGLLPYTSTDYKIKFTTTNPQIGNIDNYLNGTGGTNKVYWGNSFSIKDKLFLGVNASYIFGYMLNYNSVVLPAGEDYFNTAQRIQKNISDFCFDFGALYKINLGKSLLSVGAIYSPKQTLKGKYTLLNSKVIYLEYNRMDTIDYMENPNYTTDIPEKIGLGLSYKNNQCLFAIDYSLEKWKDTNVGQKQNMKNSSSIHIGGEYTPTHNTLSEYYKKMSYRAGLYMDNTNLYINGESIKKTGITIGATFPLRKIKQSVNLALDFGKMGTLANNLIEQYYITLRVGMNLHEIWFIKSKIQ